MIIGRSRGRVISSTGEVLQDLVIGHVLTTSTGRGQSRRKQPSTSKRASLSTCMSSTPTRLRPTRRRPICRSPVSCSVLCVTLSPYKPDLPWITYMRAASRRRDEDRRAASPRRRRQGCSTRRRSSRRRRSISRVGERRLRSSLAQAARAPRRAHKQNRESQ